MCYVDWMREEWEVTSCSGTTGLQATNCLEFVEVLDPATGTLKKEIRFKATGAWWGNVTSYSPNGDIVTGTRNQYSFQITRYVPLVGKAELSCSISGSSPVRTGGESSFQSALMLAPSAKSKRASRRVGGNSNNPPYGGSWTAQEGG